MAKGTTHIVIDLMERRGKRRGILDAWIHKTQAISVLGPVLLILVAGLFFSVLFIAGAFWYLAYGINIKPAEKVHLPSVSQPTVIRWHVNDSATISAQNDRDLLAAIGYVHATNQLWQMMLWRQTAEGNLTSWFGPGMLQLDRMSRRLRFAALAKSTFERLPTDKQAMLSAYADGVNAAIGKEVILTHDEFALLNIEPELWEPWHTLAVERLFAWLSVDTSSLPADHASRESELAGLLDSDRKMRTWLHIHSFDQSMAAVLPGDAFGNPPVFFYRFSYGSSVLPIIQEITIAQSDRSDLFVATVPGTLLFLSMQEPGFSWALLPESPASLSYSDRIDSTITPVYERIIDRAGSEYLTTFEHHAGKLVLTQAGESRPDSVLELSWIGLQEGTDAFAFLERLHGRRGALALQTGQGLTLHGFEWEVLGDTLLALPIGDSAGVVVGSTDWTPFVAAHLDSLSARESGPPGPGNWSNECYSGWAELRANVLTPHFVPAPQFPKREHLEALAYWRNWDYRYDPSSIGASISSYFFEQLHASDARLDSTSISLAFEKAVDSLIEKYGPDLSQWRYEVTHPVYRYYPAWSTDSTATGTVSSISFTRFAALPFSGKGHPSALCWGSLNTDSPLPASARWETWTDYANDQPAIYWNRHTVPSAFLDRYLLVNRPNVMYRLNEVEEREPRITRLLPPS